MANLDAVKSEIGAGADERNKDGWTPLHYAAHADKVSIAERLIAHRVDVDARNNKGHSPLGIARIFGSKSVEVLLFAHGGEQYSNDRLKIRRDGQIETCRFLFSFYRKMRASILAQECTLWKSCAIGTHFTLGYRDFCGKDLKFLFPQPCQPEFSRAMTLSAGDWRDCPNGNCALSRGT